MTIIQSFANVPTELITFLIGGGIIGVIISIISLLLMDSAKTKWTWKENLFFIFFIVFGAMVITGIVMLAYPGEYYYQIIVDDNISISQITEKYEIIENQGISLIVKERGD